MNPDNDSKLTRLVIGACIAVHREIGPGEDEIAYEHALSLALSVRGIPHQRQLALRLRYKDRLLDCGYPVDAHIDGRLPVELKSVEGVLPLHHAQLLTYLRLPTQPLGLLVNFDVPALTSA